MPHCPSTVSSTCSAGDASRTITRDVAGTTTGRLVSVCGQIGVTTKARTSGVTIGPPAARVYAVEPVGVATMSPSAR